jgi:hypothetical protein
MADYRSIDIADFPVWLADDDEEGHGRALAVYDAMVRAGIVNDYDGFKAVCEEAVVAIREEDFHYYAEEFAYGIGAISDWSSRDVGTWPLHCIDWHRAADELAHDYTQFELNGDVYYVLSP